ncbi:MAG TPA: hypothetical protein ENN05_04865 [Deltaproteobacteria bacterium]|nr:hypothetical protein [Deltaproteobacteria bacterium]
MKTGHESCRNFSKGIWAGFAVLVIVILCSGCPLKKQVKKEPSEVVVKTDPILVYSFKDNNKNSKFEPWYYESIIEEKWFFRENEDIIIYIPHDKSKKGDEVSYLIIAPNGTKIINKHVLMSDGGCLKIQAGCEIKGEGKEEKVICTKVGKYLSATGGYGTFEIQAFVNDRMIGSKKIKIGPPE